MISYKYVAQNSVGQRVNGVIEAFDEIDAAAKIRNQYDVVISIKEMKGSGIELSGFLNMEIGGGKIDPKAFTMMCSQFSTILSAGIPIARAVKLITDRTTDKTLKKILEKVGADVEAGRTLSSGFEEHGGGRLPTTFVETLRAGEESGSMASSFQSIYEHFDKQTKMGAKVRGAMTYPAFVMVIAVVVVIVLMVKVVPTFTSIFDELGGELPVMTRMLIGISNFVRDTFVYFLIIVAVLGIAFTLYKRTDKGAVNIARLQLKLPVLGNIATLNAASLFSNTMATMINAGLPMTKAVSITSKVMTNKLIEQKISAMSARIEEGRTVSDALKEADVMPDILVDMVGVGEETGEMERTLNIISKYYDSELETAVSKAIAMLEPATLIFIAVVAGFIVISIYMAMFSMYGSM